MFTSPYFIFIVAKFYLMSDAFTGFHLTSVINIFIYIFFLLFNLKMLVAKLFLYWFENEGEFYLLCTVSKIKKIDKYILKIS